MSGSAPEGFRLIPGALSPEAQAALVVEVLKAAERAPFVQQRTPSGKPMSALQTSLGTLGWTTDARGYRYEPVHPETGGPWPPMPDVLLDLWRRYADHPALPDACLVNLYRGDARMGLHQDADEQDFSAPVLSVSLGDTAVFRIGGLKRGDPTRSVRLASGDLCLLAGAARRAFHGVDRVIPGSSRLIPGGGRINLTLRKAA